MSDKPDFDIAERQYAEIRELRAKLQAAEEALAADDPSSHIIEWKSRAEAAEEEVKELQSELKNWTENGFQYDWEQECIRLQAEVARLRAIHNTYYNKPFADAVSEAARTATEAALRWAANDIQSHDHPVLIWDAWIRSGRKALLGEGWDA